jgi:hypothetical protein
MTFDEMSGWLTEAGASEEVIQKLKSDAPATVTDLDSDCVDLMEGPSRQTGVMRIKIIDPGQGTTAFYPVEVLKRDGPKVFKAGTHMYINHPTDTELQERPERDLRDLAAVLSENAAWDDNGPKGPGLYASAQVFSDHRATITEKASAIGLSIRARGKSKMAEVDGRLTKVAVSFDEAVSVDFVTRAGRGGALLTESGRPAAEPKEKKVATVQIEDTELATLREAAGKVATLETQFKEADERAKRLEAENKATEIKTSAASVVDGILKEAANEVLPEKAKATIRKYAANVVPVKDGEFDEAAYKVAVNELVKDQIDILTEANGGKAIVKGMGASEGDGKSAKKAGKVDEKALFGESDKRLRS